MAKTIENRLYATLLWTQPSEGAAFVELNGKSQMKRFELLRHSFSFFVFARLNMINHNCIPSAARIWLRMSKKNEIGLDKMKEGVYGL